MAIMKITKQVIKKEQYVEITEFDDIVYIKFVNFSNKDWECLRKVDFDKISKKTLIEDLETGGFDYDNKLYLYKPEYIENHYLEGDWNGGDTDLAYKYDDPFEALQKGDRQYLFMGHPSNDGWIYHLDGSPVIRKIQCEFWEDYYGKNLSKLQKELEKRKKWSDIELHRNEYWRSVGEHTLYAKYLPTKAEMKRWRQEDSYSHWSCNVGDSYGLIHDQSYIKKFYCNNEY